MTKFDNSVPNQFCWVELATSDPAAAKQFYAKIFGWKLNDMETPNGNYTVAKVGDANVCGLMLLPEEAKKMGAPPNWLSYVAVEDANAAAKKIEANGGKVLKAPFDAGGMGMMAVIQDPTGAVFSLWQEKQSMGGYLYQETGAVCWNELMTPNVDAAGKFYATVFGWKPDAMKMEDMVYTLFKKGDFNVGGMMGTPKEMSGAPPAWSVYFAVENTDETAKTVKANGGTVLSPPMDIPNVGRFAVFADPQGAVFCVLQAAPQS
jgi:predicted enzyme related to lactoylglutathione lyase